MSGPVRGQPVTLNTLRDVDPTGIAKGSVPTWDGIGDFVMDGSIFPSVAGVAPAYDKYTLTAAGAQTKTLSFLPVDASEHVYLNGVEQQKGVDWSRGSGQALLILTAMDARSADVLEVRYLHAGDAPVLTNVMEFAGTANNDASSPFYPAQLWDMTDVTVGRRVSGVWTFTATSDIIDEGTADAYSAEATVVTAPPSGDTPIFFDWYACTVSNPRGLGGGVTLQTDNSTMTLYLYRNGTAVLSSSVNIRPVAGDDIKLITDFSTRVATAYRNGTSIASLNFATQTWFVAGGTP